MSTEGKVSIYGSGSDMPIDYLLRKQERTCMYESPTIVEDFQRQTLKDLRPLKPLFESDEVRGGRDVDGQAFGNNLSERFLTFRDTGFQSRDDVDGAYQPDGTFINTGGATELDPRGTALGPNMRAHVDQQFARGSHYNYRSDADNSVPESGINPYDMNKNVRGIQNISKAYYKNFSTGFDSWHNGGMAPGYAVSNKQKLMDDQIIKDPATNPNCNKMDATTSLSNNLKIGWRRTTDNRFEVSKYGKKNIGKVYSNEDWYKNRANASVDHDVLLSWQGTNVSKSAALKIMDLSKQNSTKHWTGLQGMTWDESKLSKGTKVKLAPKDMAGMSKRPSAASQSKTPHDTLKGETSTKSGDMLMIHDAPTITKTRITSTIFEKMGQSNQAVTKTQKSDLRKDIKRSMRKETNEIVETNKKQKNQAEDNSIFWDSIAVFKKGKSKTVVNYKAAKKDKAGNNMNKLDKHKFNKESYVSQQHKQKIPSQVSKNKSQTKYDNNFGREGTFNQSKGEMGTKQTMQYIDRDNNDNYMSDMSSRN
jgi:hypothetical protein